MATFTATLEEVFDFCGARVEIVEGRAVFTPGHTPTGLEHYPVVSEEARAELNGIIADHFWNREIGFETVSLFTHNLRSHMNIHMPRFNELYRAAALEFDVLTTTDMKTTSRSETAQTSETVADSENKSSSKNESRSVFSDTPQTMLSGDEDYAANATDATAWTTGEGEGSERGTADSLSESDGETRVTGFSSSPALLVREFQEARLNIHALVLESLNTLFMGIWQNSDSFTEENGYYDYPYFTA